MTPPFNPCVQEIDINIASIDLEMEVMMDDPEDVGYLRNDGFLNFGSFAFSHYHLNFGRLDDGFGFNIVRSIT